MDMTDLTSSGITAGTVERSLHPVQGTGRQAAGDGSLVVVPNAQDVAGRAADTSAAPGGEDQRGSALGRIVGKGTLIDVMA